jgi:hypothetical protein
LARFPFVTAEEIRAARSRHTAGAPGGDAYRRLLMAMDRILTEPKFAAPLDQPIRVNLLMAQDVLFEASLAFRLTGDERFIEPVRRLLARLSQETYRRARLPEELHLGSMLVGIAVAAELCGNGIDQELVSALAAELGEELVTAAAHENWGERLPQRDAWNHTAIAYAGIGCAGLLLRGDEPADAWTAEAVARMKGFFANGVTAAGMTREGLHYAGFTFRNIAPFLLACRHAGIFDYCDPQDNPDVERLRRVPRWYALEIFPRGSWLQNLNDSHWSPQRALGGFLPIFNSLDPIMSAWVHRRLVGADGDRSQGDDPRRCTSTLFETVLWPPLDRPELADLPEILADSDIGYVVERVRETPYSGFSFNCGPFFGGIHDQSDNGSVTLFAHEVPLLIDSGAGNEPVEGSVSSSYGHNVVLIDARGQWPAGKGRGVSGVINGAERSAPATVLTADLVASYAVMEYAPLAQALRHCVYGKRPFPYLLIVDDFACLREGPATFDQLFHTPPATDVRRGKHELDLVVDFDGARSGLMLRALDDCLILERQQMVRSLPWPEHPVWVFRRTGRHVIMATLALPYHDGNVPQVAGHLDARRGRVTLRWRHNEESGVDVLHFAPKRSTSARFTRNGAAPASAVTMISTPRTVVPRSAPASRSQTPRLPGRIRRWWEAVAALRDKTH